MTAREAQARMAALENHDQPWSVEEYLRWVAGLDDADPDDVGNTVREEVRRAIDLAEGHYQRVTNTVAILRPDLLATVAFQQGMTFAAAALGRQPHEEETR
jgi:hypothetical protein